MDVSRLPKFQDCHEMWSRRKRKKEAKGVDAAKSHPHSSGGGGAKPLGSRPASLSPVVPQRESSQPPAEPCAQRPLCEEVVTVPKSLSVPLPSAPLTDNILESLTTPVTEGVVAMSAVPQPMPLLGQNRSAQIPIALATVPAVQPGRAQQLQKVIEVQRSLISELSKQLGTDAGRMPMQSQYFPTALTQPHTHTQMHSLVQDVFSHTKQTFDYGNQSNKKLEKEADEQLEREYYGEPYWRTP